MKQPDYLILNPPKKYPFGAQKRLSFWKKYLSSHVSGNKDSGKKPLARTI